MAGVSTAQFMEHKPTSLSNAADRPADLSGVTVMQVIPELATGGAERTTLEVSQAITAAGGHSLVVSQGGGMVAQLEAEGGQHVTLPVATKNPLKVWQNAQALKALIKQHGVGLVHARSRAPAWSALWAARGQGVPFVTTYHGIYRARTRLKRFVNSVMVRGDRVIANSEYTAQAVRKAYGAAPYFGDKKLVVIPRGADLSRFDPDKLSQTRRDAAQSAFGGQGAYKILLPGRLTAWKGQAVLIEAAKHLKEMSLPQDFRIVMIGSAQGRDGYEQSLQADIDAAGLQKCVYIHGHWDDMPAAFAWADVAISASLRPEAFGRVAVEAQAMGCPIIASAHGGALETVDDGKTGFLIPVADASALAKTLQIVMQQSTQTRDMMKDMASQRIHDHFSIETMTRATLSVYNSLIPMNGRAGPGMEK